MQECYKAIGGNYEAVLGRLHSEALIQRFTLKFLEDQSYLQLKQALENKNYEDAFRSAHTLKGVCQNLSFDRLYEVSDKSLPNQIYSQNLIKVMQEKIDFFKSNSGINSIDYNASSGQLTIINEKQKIIYQRDDPGFDVFKVLEVSEKDIQNIVDLLEQTSIKNKEISLQIKARFRNKRQMYNLKLHTLWTPLKKDGYIGIIGYFDIVKQKNAKEAQKEDPNEKENPALAGITILAMTANAFDEDRKKALKCGMDGFLSKPIVIEELISILQKNLDQVSGVLEKPHK